jgi:hypothetical protein
VRATKFELTVEADHSDKGSGDQISNDVNELPAIRLPLPDLSIGRTLPNTCQEVSC